MGATKPEEAGYHFWWGNTVGYVHGGKVWNAVDGSEKGFNWANCPTCGPWGPRALGYTDVTGNLTAAHDAATAHLGAPWRMPTAEEWRVLIRNCDTEWIVRNCIYGLLVKGRGAYSQRSIFLPAAGLGEDSSLGYTGSVGIYWSSTPDSDYSNLAWSLYFASGDFRRLYYYRYGGQSVRPLRVFAK